MKLSGVLCLALIVAFLATFAAAIQRLNDCEKDEDCQSKFGALSKCKMVDERKDIKKKEAEEAAAANVPETPRDSSKPGGFKCYLDGIPYA